MGLARLAAQCAAGRDNDLQSNTVSRSNQAQLLSHGYAKTHPHQRFTFPARHIVAAKAAQARIADQYSAGDFMGVQECRVKTLSTDYDAGGIRYDRSASPITTIITWPTAYVFYCCRA